jgi:hypothetical protein
MQWIFYIVVPVWLIAGIFAYAIKKHACKIYYERCCSRGHRRKDERCCWHYGLFGLLGLIAILDYKHHNFEQIGLCWKMPQELKASQKNKKR